MYTCANCTVYACRQEDRQKMPKNCPIRQEELIKASFAQYQEPENHDFYVTSSELEADGYCQWPRLKETVEMCRRMDYTRVGLAFCWGLRKEAKVVSDLLRQAGLEVVSVICKAGGIPKEEIGISTEHRVRPGTYEVMCNPIGQAMLLNEQKTQFNIALGLCVGHDSLFYKYSEALVTTLVAKDRVTGHNPAAAIYCAESYFQKRNL